MKKLALLLVLALSPLARAITLSSVSLAPYGAGVVNGSSQQFTQTCTYSDGSTDDCTIAGGGTFSSSIPTWMSVSTSGLATGTVDPGADNSIGANVIYSVGGLVTSSTVYIQHPGDTWYGYMTPDYRGYVYPITEAQLPLNFVPGSTITVGYGLFMNSAGGSGNGTPASRICVWSSDYPAIATVNQIGQVTAVSATAIGDGGVAGAVTITCNRSGNAVYGSSTQSGWQAPGNFIQLNVVAGGTSNQIWYVRPGGGTPYTGTNTPAGQCNGKADVDYPGVSAQWVYDTYYPVGAQVADYKGRVETVTVAGTTGAYVPSWPTSSGTTTSDGTVTWTSGATYATNQACAMGNLRYLWSDEATYQQLQWMISGGDTVIVRQNSNGYNVGLDAPGGQPGWLPYTCAGKYAECSMPSIPSGTAARHTRILGENYASCHSDSAKTKLIASYGEGHAIYVGGSQYVDVACFEITDKAACASNTNYLNSCNPTTDDYGDSAVAMSALTSYVNLTDLFIHGLSSDGIDGPSGIGVVEDYVHVRGVSSGGINMDNGPWGLGNVAVAGGLTLTNSTTEFVGCVEEYPIVHNYPYIECRDQNTGSYGDGFGTGSTVGDWNFNNDIWRYNYQDGLDLLHSGMHSLIVTNSQSYGNNGNQLKIGSGSIIKLQNNSIVSNCNRISQVIGDEPTAATVQSATNSVTISGFNLTYSSGVVVAAIGGPAPTAVAGTAFTLGANTTTYVWVDPATFTILHNTTGFPTVPVGFLIAIITTDGSGIVTNGYNGLNQQVSQCRAGGAAVVLRFSAIGSVNVENNSVAGYGSINWENGCEGTWGDCSTSVTVFQNNINLGILNPASDGGALPSTFYTDYFGPGFGTVSPNGGWATRTYNNYYNMRAACEASQTGEVCSNPLFVSQPALTMTGAESVLDNFNFNLSSSSSLTAAGIAVSGLTTDQAGNLYLNPPSMGALQFGAPSSTTFSTSGSIVFSGSVSF